MIIHVSLALLVLSLMVFYHTLTHRSSRCLKPGTMCVTGRRVFLLSGDLELCEIVLHVCVKSVDGCLCAVGERGDVELNTIVRRPRFDTKCGKW